MNKRLMQRFALLLPEGDASTSGGAPAAAAPAAAPPADAGAAPAGTPPAGTQDSAPAFADSLGDADLKAFYEAKGFKTPAEAIKAMRDAETANARPETPDAYELPVPEGQDKAFAKQASGWFHEAGMTKAQAQAVVGKFNEHVAAQNAAAALAETQAGEAQVAALKTEWGGQYDANLERGRMAAKTFGITQDQLGAIEKSVGAAQILRTFSMIGAAISEGTLNAGGNGADGGPAVSADPDKARAHRMFPSMRQK